MHPANVKRDTEDLFKFICFLRSHNPFSLSDNDELRNIATGEIADSRVNCDKAEIIGQGINARLDGLRYGDLALKKADQVDHFCHYEKTY